MYVIRTGNTTTKRKRTDRGLQNTTQKPKDQQHEHTINLGELICSGRVGSS